MNKPWQVILVLIGIFAAGGVAGGFLTARMLHDKFVNRPVPEEWAPRHLRRLNERFNLTPEQQEQVTPIVRRNMEQLNRIRNASMEETKKVVEAMQREINEKLTPEQRAKFEQMNREMREAREARDKVEKAKRANSERLVEGGRLQKEKDMPKDKDRPPGDRPPPPPDKPPGN